MNDCYRVWMLVLSLPLLHGCAGAMIAAHALPTVFGGISIAGAEDRSPFRIKMPDSKRRTDNELATLDEQIRLAGCGDAKSQFWLASALKNDFNTSPNSIEIYKWFRLAEIGEYAPASAELVALDQTLSEVEIGEAKSRARAWKPTGQGCSG